MTTNRTAKDYAIEFGGYLADATEQFLCVLNDKLTESLWSDTDFTLNDDTINDHWRSLQSAIYEFRRRARFANRDAPEQLPDILTAIREIARRTPDEDKS